MYLLRVKMAAMGIVDDNVDENSGLSPDLAAGGSWYGTTVVFFTLHQPYSLSSPQLCDAIRYDTGWG